MACSILLSIATGLVPEPMATEFVPNVWIVLGIPEMGLIKLKFVNKMGI